MICPSKLMVNKFRVVPTPKPRELFSRFGSVDAQKLSYTGDDAVNFNQSKIDKINEVSAELAE